MKVNIDYDDGQYYLRCFDGTHGPERYQSRGDWLKSAVDLPEYVVRAYAVAQDQWATMSNLLRHYDPMEKGGEA